MTNLIRQATDVKDRYSKVTHDHLSIGDIVLLKEDCHKPVDYPLGRIKSLQVNDLGEITGAVVLKGKTGELVKRHSSVIIPVLKMSECNPTNSDNDEKIPQRAAVAKVLREKRAAAQSSEEKTRKMLLDGNIV